MSQSGKANDTAAGLLAWLGGRGVGLWGTFRSEGTMTCLQV